MVRTELTLATLADDWMVTAAAVGGGADDDDKDEVRLEESVVD